MLSKHQPGDDWTAPGDGPQLPCSSAGTYCDEQLATSPFSILISTSPLGASHQRWLSQGVTVHAFQVVCILKSVGMETAGGGLFGLFLLPTLVYCSFTIHICLLALCLSRTLGRDFCFFGGVAVSST